MKEVRWKIAQWFEKKWWNNYLKNKKPEKYLEWKKEYWNKFLQKVNIEIQDDQSLMDIGCGPAGIFILSQNTKSSWKALDPLLENYQSLKIFNKEKYPNVSFVETTFEDYQGKDKSAIVFCINAINHFLDLDYSLKKLSKLLNQNGRLILSTDTHNSRFIKTILYHIPLDILHPHQYTEKEYEKMFEENNFKIINKTLMKKERIFSYHVYELKRSE